MKQSIANLLLALFIACLLPRVAAFGETIPSTDSRGSEAACLPADLDEQLPRLNSFGNDTALWPTVGPTGSSQAIGQDLLFTHPLASVADNDVSLSTGTHCRPIDESRVVPQEVRAAAFDPWKVNLGLHYTRPLGEGWKASTDLSMDSASDRPTATLREMNVGLNATLRMPYDERNTWIFTVNYSPVNETNVPMPGVAFSYDPTPRFHASIGFPFQVTYRPTDFWEFQASYMLVHTIHAKTLYKISDRFRAFAAYDWASETIVLVDLPESNAQFTINDPRVSTGLQSSLPWHWTALTSVGYAFDRYLFDGTSLSRPSVPSSDLGNGAFASMNVDLRY